MPALNWNDWMNGWSAAFPKNSMWGKIRSGENDPETGEPLYRFNDKPSTASMDPELADVMAEHRFVVPFDKEQTLEHCFCGWEGESWGKHYQDVLSSHAGDHNAPVENAEGEKSDTSHEEKDDKAHKATRKPGPRGATKEPGDEAHLADKEPSKNEEDEPKSDGE